MTSAETLHVKNFAGIEDAHIELSRMNVFIGPQASGKSVCAKLLFYFKEIIRRLGYRVFEERNKAQMRTEHKDLFLNYFPPSTWSDGIFEIDYSFGDLWLKVTRTGIEATTVTVAYSDYYTALLSTARHMNIRGIREADNSFSSFDIYSPEDLQTRVGNKIKLDIGPVLANRNYFIPAGRSFFSTLRSSVFSFIASDVGIDPFLAEFGRLYETTRANYHRVPHSRQRRVDRKLLVSRISSILKGNYKRIARRDFIETEDGRQVAVENSSSGQQEALPLAIALAGLTPSAGTQDGVTLFVEEPEAHLYPNAQREIVHLLAAVTDLSSDDASGQYVITTHSPYILSALNNLMYGAQIAKQSPEKAKQVGKALGDAALVAPENVRAYAFGEGKVQSIIDPETHLVRATVLDNVSTELAKEFEALVDIEFEEEEIAA